jgi:hypothetical protein
MLPFIFADQNLPFAVALALMLIIAILEGAATFLGAGISGVLDSLLPDLDFDLGVDVDADLDMPGVGSPSILTSIMAWLRLGQVPALVLLVIFLTSFGLVGYGLQMIFVETVGVMLPSLLAGVVAFVFALPIVRVGGGILVKIMPKDETDAVAEESFIGLVAVVTLGAARAGSAAQGKLKDRHGQTHYVMIEPDNEDEMFPQGTEVLLVKHSGAIFKAIRNTNEVLGKK